MMKLAESVTLLIADMGERQRESLTVAALRDTLLPKLISGELRVRDLKKTIPGDGQREVDCDARMQP